MKVHAATSAANRLRLSAGVLETVQTMMTGKSAGEIFSRNIDWNLFKTFEQVARHGGIGAAGRALNRQQPSVSAALKKLEAQLGAALCIRSKKGVVLTAFGEHVLTMCATMSGALGGLPAIAASQRERSSKLVTLRVISNLHLVAELNVIFDDFRRLHPDTEIKLDVVSWRAVLQALAYGEVDLGIGFDSNETDGLLKIPIFDQVQQLYCGPGHRLFGRIVNDPMTLHGEPFVVTKSDPLLYDHYRERYGFGEHVGGVADNLQERMWLIQLGVGIGFLPEPVVGDSAFAAALWPLLPRSMAPTSTLYFMARAGVIDDPAAAELWARAIQHLGSPTDHGRRQPSARRGAYVATNEAKAAS